MEARYSIIDCDVLHHGNGAACTKIEPRRLIVEECVGEELKLRNDVIQGGGAIDALTHDQLVQQCLVLGESLRQLTDGVELLRHIQIGIVEGVAPHATVDIAYLQRLSCNLVEVLEPHMHL